MLDLEKMKEQEVAWLCAQGIEGEGEGVSLQWAQRVAQGRAGDLSFQCPELVEEVRAERERLGIGTDADTETGSTYGAIEPT